MYLWSGRPLWRCCESIRGHFQTQRCRQAVDRSCRISGMQQPVSSLEDLETTWWDTQECTSGAVDRSEALFNVFGSISRHGDTVEQSTARIVSHVCSDQF